MPPPAPAGSPLVDAKTEADRKLQKRLERWAAAQPPASPEAMRSDEKLEPTTSADPAAFKLDAKGRVVPKHAAELEATTEEPEATAEELAAAAEVSWDVGRTCHY